LYTQDNTIRWSHVANRILVEGSDGNAYLLGCDRAWRYSKCFGLTPGGPYRAWRSNKGLIVESRDAKGKVNWTTYVIYEVKSLR